jgi:RNA polymerase sigma-70 factor (ECF subfamily)
MLKLFGRLREFEYDATRGSFRAWLKTVTQNALRDFGRRNNNIPQAIADSDIRQQLQNEPARQDFSQRIEEAYDLELLGEAKTRVKARVAKHTWQAFEMIEHGTMPVDQIATAVGMQITMVYVARGKVKKMLKQELQQLEVE